MNVLIWHVHGSWTTAFVQGRHTSIVPVVPDRGPDGRGRAQTYAWPDHVIEATPAQLADMDLDVVILQRPRDEELAHAWLGGRRLGRDISAVWLEHNAPQGRIAEMRHPAADRDDLIVVHVTPTNALFWDTGTTRTTVIEHGIVDPGYRYRGNLERIAVAVNEPLRRGRVTGTDLLPSFAEEGPIDLFGIDASSAAARIPGVTAHDDVPQHELHDALAARRLYLHPYRWTSLGLALLEAMHLGLPIVALGTLEVPEAVPPEAGFVSTRPDVLRDGLRRLLHDHDEARERGAVARAHALAHFGLGRFTEDWDRLLKELTS